VGKKRLGNIATVLGGLGAAYLASGMAGKSGTDSQGQPRGRFVEVDPHHLERAKEIVAKPFSISGKTSAEIAEMVRNPINRDGGLTDSEMRRLTDTVGQMRGRNYVRTEGGAPIFTEDGSLLQFGSERRPVVNTSGRHSSHPYGVYPEDTFKKGGKVSSAKGSKTSSTKVSKVSSASKRADGIAQRGKTRGRIV
jgi:hypothetical protein